MELYIGGFAQGKLAYVKGLYPQAKIYEKEEYEKLLFMNDSMDDSKDDSKENPEENSLEIQIWNQFHETIKKELAAGKSANELKEEVLSLGNRNNLVIISDEIGNGIVPMEKEERFYREFTGRLLTELAAKAVKVVRITCGIASQIK